jgi:hypothetical protein
MFYVMCINNHCAPGELFGPYDLWDDAVTKCECLILRQCPNVTHEELDTIEDNAGYVFDDGSGVYIIQAE